MTGKLEWMQPMGMGTAGISEALEAEVVGGRDGEPCTAAQVMGQKKGTVERKVEDGTE